MRKLLIVIFLIGLETRALAHEDRISAFDFPGQLALSNLLYALPGIALVFALRSFLPKLHIVIRLGIASFVPAILWVTVFFLAWVRDISFLEMLENLTWSIFSTDFSATFVPGIIAILGVGIVDHRKQSKPAQTGRYSSVI